MSMTEFSHEQRYFKESTGFFSRFVPVHIVLMFCSVGKYFHRSDLYIDKCFSIAHDIDAHRQCDMIGAS